MTGLCDARHRAMRCIVRCSASQETLSRLDQMMNELTCRELVELVTDYFENALSDIDRARVEQHLAACDGCDTYVSQMRQTIQTLGRLEEKDISSEAQEKLLRAFRDWHETRKI